MMANSMVGLTYAKISPKMVNLRDVAGNAEEAQEEGMALKKLKLNILILFLSEICLIKRSDCCFSNSDQKL